MVFDEKLALWFNEAYVTMEIPPQSDLDTWLEVGSWTWGWMEPPLGTISFVLLALQVRRNRGRLCAVSNCRVWRIEKGE